MTAHFPPLSLLPSQHGIWLADQISEEKNVYTIAHCIELHGEIDMALLDRAIHSTMCEADTVTALYGDGHQQLQPPLTPEQFPETPVYDWRDQPQQRAWDWMAEDIRQPNTCAGGSPGFRHQVFRVADHNGKPRWLWYQRFHHIMLDGYSFTALTRRVAAHYTALHREQPPEPSPFCTVVDVLQEYDDYEKSPSFNEDRDFWQQYCADLPLPETLSQQPLGELLPTATQHSHDLQLPTNSLPQLQALANAQRLSVPHLLMAAMAIYLYRMTGNRQQVIGIPFMRRMGSVAVNAVAPVVTVLPLRLSIEADADWLAVARQIKQQLKKLRKHSRYDAERIQRDLQLVGSGRRLYGPLINYRMFDYALQFGEVDGVTRHLAAGPIDDFEFGLMIRADQIQIELRADASRYSEQTLQAHATRLPFLFAQLISMPKSPLDALSMVTDAEQATLQSWGTGAVVNRPDTVHNILDLFFLQCQQQPRQTALVMADQQLTFAQLGSRVNQLSRHLLAQGLQPGVAVAVALPRSIDAISCQLAVMNAGGCWLPLDLDYPRERIDDMLEQAQPGFIMTLSNIALPPSSAQHILLDSHDWQSALAMDCAPLSVQERPQTPAGDLPAYVIFTSGSTGKPKGVQIPHRALLNLTLCHREQLFQPVVDEIQQRHGRRARVAHTHSMAFDSAWAHVVWLVMGQELHIFDDELRRDAFAMVQAVGAAAIDVLDLPPSLCSALLSNGLMTSAHRPSYVGIGGEAAPAALWHELRQWPELHTYNLYGPTEYTMDAVGSAVMAASEPVLGRPIGNTCSYVLNDMLQRVPVGSVGELYLAGMGLARGYVGRENLSASHFVANPFVEGERMYRTGDLVRWNPQGQIEYLGRGDDQVKVRGYRVELGEVENALSLLPGVEAATVITEVVNNSHRLLGYCAMPTLPLDNTQSHTRELLQLLQQTLPSYMVPASLTLLHHLPRNTHGKIDKHALPRPSLIIRTRVAPKGARERTLCKTIAITLGLDDIGAEDDFFDLGGDSILAIGLCTRLRENGYQLRPAEVFRRRTARAMAVLLESLVAVSNDAVGMTLSPQEHQRLLDCYGHFQTVAPVLPLQQGMLYLTQVDEGSAHYNAYTRIEFRGPLEPKRLRKALDAVVSQHPQLAGLFDLDNAEQPVFLLPPVDVLDWPWRYEDLSPLPPAERDTQITALTTEVCTALLDTGRFGGMLQACLIKQTEHHYSLLMVIHHLIIDGWSTPLVLRDLLAAYRDNRAPNARTSSPYAGVLQQLCRRDLSTSRQLWQRYLSAVKPCRLFDGLEPTDTVEEAGLQLSPDISARLLAETRARGLTLNLVMQGIWALALSAISGRNHVVFGMPVSGRSAAINGIENQVGLFLNTLPIAIDLQPEQSLWCQLQAMAEQHMELLDNDGPGLAEIQQLAGGETLFDTLLVVENYPDNDYLGYDLAGVRISDIHNRGYSHYPLALLVIPGERIELLVENRGVLAAPAQLVERIARFVHTLLDEPETTLAHYPLQTPDEKALLERINRTERSLPEATLRSRLREQAQLTPSRPALADTDDMLTYAQLRYQVECLAAQLRGRGVDKGDIIAVALPRSVRLSITLLAIIEAGAVYLPLDIGYPDDRLNFMLEDAAPALLITDSNHHSRFKNQCPRQCFNQLIACGHAPYPINNPLSPDDPAYLIYTSGTTGRPKGVLVSHRAIVNRIEWMQHAYALTPEDVVLQKTPCSFDVSVWEFFWAYTVGAQLVMAAPDAHRDPQALRDSIDQFGVTTLHFVPSMLAIFCSSLGALRRDNEPLCPGLRHVFCSGEALSKTLAREFSQTFTAALHNLYGPTEAAVDVTYKPAFGDLSDGGSGVPIGLPVWNTQLRVLDQLLRPVPIGTSGELYLCGVQLALGYLNRTALSATRFVADPFVDGQRMYRTGDRVRWLASGEVEYLGRTDHQVKIRGQRIELGEIESIIKQQPEVTHTVVLARTLGTHDPSAISDGRQLVAYFVLHEGAHLTGDALKQRLQRELAPAMVPVAYIPLDTLPLSANGKLDRNALPAPDLSGELSGRRGKPPAAGLESRLAAVFERVLDIEKINANDDFFAIGGHSLLAMTLAVEIRKALERPVSVGHIVVAPTVEKLAAHLSGLIVNDANSGGFAPVIHLREGKQTPLICVYPGSGFSWQYSVLSRYLDNDMPIIGLQSPRPDGAIATSNSMHELIDKQLAVVRQVQPSGPYNLLGHSLGGTIAYGLAARLREQGEQVDFLGLLDTYPAEVHNWNDADNAEANRDAEREQQFLNVAMADGDSQLQGEHNAMLEQIFANYEDAVALLAHTRTPRYDGEVMVFVAQKSLPDYIQPRESWRPYASQPQFHFLKDCEHQDILSPRSLRTLGPLIQRLIKASRNDLSAPVAEVTRS